MATIVSSSFTAADSTALAGFEDWTAHPLTDDSSFPPRIMSNRLGVATGTNNRLWYRNTAPGTADYSVKTNIYRNASNNGNGGVCARLDATASTFYHLRFTGTALQLYKFVAGAATQLGSSYTITPAVGSTNEIELVCDGTSISGKLNGTTVIGPITDSSITAAGYAGFRLSTPYLELDDFGADTLASGPVAVAFAGPVANQTGTEGSAFSLDLSTYFSGTETPFSYAVQAGTLPAGLSLNASTGVISGTPTATDTQSGIVVRATDATPNAADTNAFSITINAPSGDTTLPELTGAVTFSSITQTSYTASWPAGSDNVAVTGYEYQIGSTAGAWTDAGNNLSAAITGRTAGTTETVYVRAYDAAGLRSTPAISGEVTLLSAVAGITVTEPLKNNTGTVLASQSGVRVAVLQAADLVSVYETSGLTTNASGVLSQITDAAIVAGQQYHVAIKLADGGVGITGPITAS